jgi:hypothetical protein
VGGDVGHGRRLGSRIRGVPRGTGQVPGRRVGVTGRRPGLGHRHLAASPGPATLDRSPRAIVVGTKLLEVVEDVLGAARRPDREPVMIGLLERPAPPDRYEPRVPDIAQDHRRTVGS